ncbi:hypothetical protein DZE42_004267 [Clostridium beijerinckii]|nr:hypothetical protein [Clostridium beijerinckii]
MSKDGKKEVLKKGLKMSIWAKALQGYVQY